MRNSNSYPYHSIMTSLLKTLIVSSLLLISSFSLAHDSKDKHLELGVYPHLSKKHLQRAYGAIAEELSKAVGQTIHFDVDDNLENFHLKLEQQKYDLVVIQPFDYVVLADHGHYEALATQEKPLRAAFAVKNSSHLQKVHNLLGRDVYLPPSSTAVSYLAKYHLMNSGINIEKDLNIIHERTHLTCLQKLVIGLADTCVTTESVVHFFEEKVGVDLRVIAMSPAVPHALFATKQSMQADIREKLLKEILSWTLEGEDKELLENARFEKFKAINDSDYNIVRQIKKEVNGF